MSRIVSVVREVVLDLLPDAVTQWQPSTTGVEVLVDVDGQRLCAAYLSDGTMTADAVAHVANVVQDAAIEFAGRALPACPGHLHPAAMRTTPGGVAWVCPSSGRPVREYAVPPGVVAH